MKQNTRQIIQASFRRLLLAKSLDKIKVRDIVEDCCLNRNTFYYYYEDIYDLFDDYLDAQMQEIYRTLPENSLWDAELLRLLDCVCETPSMGRHIFFSRKREAMRQYLNKVLTVTLDRYIAAEMQELEIAPEDRRLVCDTCCHALYGMIEQCLTGAEAAVLKSQLRRVTCCFEGAVRQALEYCAANPRIKEEL